MLRLIIPSCEFFDEGTETFVDTKEQVLQLEHSLVSISKWESIWEKPFFSNDNQTRKETIDYIQCMTLTQNVDPMVYLSITDDNIDQVRQYVDAKRSGTWFSNTDKKKGSMGKKIITSELIYYWMVALNIPFECQKWHLNRLMTLIQICNIENAPKKKTGRKELMHRNRNLNEARRQALSTKG